MKCSAEELIKYFDFLDVFYVAGKLSVTNERLLDIQEQMRDPAYPFAEHMYRINSFITPDTIDFNRNFFIRLTTVSRTLVGFFKKNPEYLSGELHEHLRNKPQYDWVATTFGVSRVVADIINVGDTRETVPSNKTIVTAERRLIDAMDDIARIYEIVAKSITEAQIKAMPVKDRIDALAKLAGITNKNTKGKGASQKFQQINIYKDSKEDLEKSLLDFAEEE